MSKKENIEEKVRLKDQEHIGHNKQQNNSNPGDLKAGKYIMLRNKFFSLFYRSALLIFLISISMFILSIFFVYLFAKQPVSPRYVPLNQEMRYVDLISVDQEHKTPDEVALFISKAVKKLYTRDYINYTDQLMDAGQYFTVAGYQSYLKSLSDTNNLNTMKKNRWVLSFKPKAPPVLIEKKLNNGKFTWAYDFSGQIIYSGENSRVQNVLIKVLIERMSMIDSADGMGISVFVPFEEKN